MAIVVKARPGDSNDTVIRQFQKKVLAEGLVQEIRQREYFKKPSELKKEYLAEKRRKIMRFKKYGG